MQVYHTPGHSPGSVSLWTEINGLKLLIAGDTLWGGFHPKIGSNLDDWTRSLDRLLELDIDVVTIGHSSPALIFDAKTKVREARQQFGIFFDPWFKPFHIRFVYRGL
jgi:glyoxylase-like metal-dependent hydrolase (beta-lactamase superfamily II)